MSVQPNAVRSRSPSHRAVQTTRRASSLRRHAFVAAYISVLAVGSAALTACGTMGADGSSSSSGGTGGSAPLPPATWASLYTDYFGPTGKASCSGGSDCHLTATATGAVVSNLVCADKDGCFATFTGASHLVRPATDVSNPSGASIFKELRQAGKTGRMPLKSTFTFSPSDIDQISGWISRGAKND